MKKKEMTGPMAAWLDTSIPAPYKRPPKKILDENETLRLYLQVLAEPKGKKCNAVKNVTKLLTAQDG